MRFNRIDLIRYGKFTDLLIKIPEPANSDMADFHLIVGQNEAGKSTIRNAITDLLFGIELRSRFDFLHNKSELRLGAEIQMKNAGLEFQRLKRSKQPLRDREDNILADDSLAPYIGNADRISFEREFCLDQSRLQDGSKSMLNARDDVGRMLFEASAGIGAYGEILEQLDKEAALLWGRRRTKDHAFYKALDAYNAARVTLKEVTTRTKVWKEGNRKVLVASDDLMRASENLVHLEKLRTRLDRVRRIAPHFQSRQIKMEERHHLDDSISLPEKAADDLAAAKINIEKATQRITKYQTLMDKVNEDLKSSSVDTTILAHREEILKLQEEKNRTQNHELDISKRKAESQALINEIKLLTKDLMWPLTDEENLSLTLPSKIFRKEVEELIGSHGKIEQMVTGALENVKEKERSLRALEEKLASLANDGSAKDVDFLIRETRTMGSVCEARDGLEKNISRAKKTLGLYIEKMHPWKGSALELCQLMVPSDAEFQVFRDKERDIDMALINAEEDFDEVDAALKMAELDARIFQKKYEPVAEGSIIGARQNRDEGWEALKSGLRAIDEFGSDYESRVHMADTLVDRRFESIDDVRKNNDMCETIEKLKQKHDASIKKKIKIEQRRRELLTSWVKVIDGIGLDALELSVAQSWLSHYCLARDVAEKLIEEEGSLTSLNAKIEATVVNVKKTLQQLGIADDEISNLALTYLVEKLEFIVEAMRASTLQREHLVNECQHGREALQNFRAKADSAESLFSEWKSSWLNAIQGVQLPKDVSLSGASVALSLMRDLDEKLKEHREIAGSRIEPMQKDIQNYRQAAKTLAKTILPEFAEQAAQDICINLNQKLTVAEQEKHNEQKLKADLAEYARQIEIAASLKNDAEAILIPYLKMAKLTTIEQLEIAIDRSQLLHQLNSGIEEATALMLELGDGLPLDDLIAEINAEDLSTIVARLNDINKQREIAIVDRDNHFSALKDVELTQGKIHGQADAARAEAGRQLALAKMVEITERYIKVHIGVNLLRRSIEIYRDEKRGPLLQQASRIFSTLTLGSFQALEIDYDGEVPELMGRRPNGKQVDFDGLSEGTGDQLFLSLRLAAVDMQLQHAQPLPFIADDLFTNYSDNRSLQGFKVLADLAKKSQVIYFTHHDHLVEIAKTAIGEELNVVRL